MSSAAPRLTRNGQTGKGCSHLQGDRGELAALTETNPSPPTFATTTRARARDRVESGIMPIVEAAELPPLWSEPPGFGHNGGPPLDPPRRPGRPTISTPELREAILEHLADGVPLRVICQAEGMPNRSTVYRWRRDDPAFDRSFGLMQHEGYIGLCEQVFEEVERVMEKRGAKVARFIFNLRRQQLARMNPRFFGDRGMKY
jgi:hypothetical protein